MEPPINHAVVRRQQYREGDQYFDVVRLKAVSEDDLKLMTKASLDALAKGREAGIEKAKEDKRAAEEKVTKLEKLLELSRGYLEELQGDLANAKKRTNYSSVQQAEGAIEKLTMRLDELEVEYAGAEAKTRGNDPRYRHHKLSEAEKEKGWAEAYEMAAELEKVKKILQEAKRFAEVSREAEAQETAVANMPKRLESRKGRLESASQRLERLQKLSIVKDNEVEIREP